MVLVLFILSNSIAIILFNCYYIQSALFLYFVIELQWLTNVALLIISTNIFKGLLVYVFINNIISITLISSLLLSNNYLLLISLLGKLGFYPFIFLFVIFIYNCSFGFLLIELINKWLIFSALLICCSIQLYYYCFFLLFINYYCIINIIRSSNSFKHLLFISSLIMWIFNWFLINVNAVIISWLLYYNYLLVTIALLLFIHIKITINDGSLFVVNFSSIYSFNHNLMLVYLMLVFNLIPLLLFYVKIKILVLVCFNGMIGLVGLLLLVFSLIVYLLLLGLILVIYLFIIRHQHWTPASSYSWCVENNSNISKWTNNIISYRNWIITSWYRKTNWN